MVTGFESAIALLNLARHGWGHVVLKSHEGACVANLHLCIPGPGCAVQHQRSQQEHHPTLDQIKANDEVLSMILGKVDDEVHVM